MLKIINGTNIEYTKGDTFQLEVTSEYEFPEGEKLRFTVSQNEKNTPLIERTYELSSGKFAVALDKETEVLLDLGDYIYKLTEISLSGNIETQLSGELRVKWGA